MLHSIDNDRKFRPDFNPIEDNHRTDPNTLSDVQLEMIILSAYKDSNVKPKRTWKTLFKRPDPNYGCLSPVQKLNLVKRHGSITRQMPDKLDELSVARQTVELILSFKNNYSEMAHEAMTAVAKSLIQIQDDKNPPKRKMLETGKENESTWSYAVKTLLEENGVAQNPYMQAGLHIIQQEQRKREEKNSKGTQALGTSLPKVFGSLALNMR